LLESLDSWARSPCRTISRPLMRSSPERQASLRNSLRQHAFSGYN
jgi:hypothetical protein